MPPPPSFFIVDPARGSTPDATIIVDRIAGTVHLDGDPTRQFIYRRPIPIEKGGGYVKMLRQEPSDPKRKHWHPDPIKGARKGGKHGHGLINGRGRFRG